MNKEEKNLKIRQSIQDTHKRHQTMDCKTYEIKVLHAKLNKDQKTTINTMFREAKWLRNFHIANNIDKTFRSTRTVQIKVQDRFEERRISSLGSQMIQDVFDNIKSELKGLKTKKDKSGKGGKLSFKSVCNSISLRQYGTTFAVKDEHHVRIQNIKKPLYVKGLKQIPKGAEISNAKLVRRVTGLYIYITCFIPKEEIVKQNKMVGIDFGVAHNLNLSDGRIIDIKLLDDKMIGIYSKRLNRAFIKSGKVRSKNHFRRASLLQKAYRKQNNRKYDRANKVLHDLNKSYDLIAIQDEMIANWHKGLFGKQVQQSCMGMIKAKLKANPKVIVIPRSFPSTQICPKCGATTKHPLSKRTYDCPHCGYHHPSRDIKSAQSILDYALAM